MIGCIWSLHIESFVRTDHLTSVCENLSSGPYCLEPKRTCLAQGCRVNRLESRRLSLFLPRCSITEDLKTRFHQNSHFMWRTSLWFLCHTWLYTAYNTNMWSWSYTQPPVIISSSHVDRASGRWNKKKNVHECNQMKTFPVAALKINHQSQKSSQQNTDDIIINVMRNTWFYADGDW